jgi:hypothetical protein
MRQCVCMSADDYCQILNNRNTRNHHIYTRTKRRGKGIAAGETERESVCERRTVAENRVGVCHKNDCWRVTNYFGII